MSSTLFGSAELALAAYAGLSAGRTLDQVDDLAAVQMLATQAQQFAARFPQVTAQIDGVTPSSFSATVFADPSGGLALGVWAWLAWKTRKIRRQAPPADGSVIEGEYRVEREVRRLDEPPR